MLLKTVPSNIQKRIKRKRVDFAFRAPYRASLLSAIFYTITGSFILSIVALLFGFVLNSEGIMLTEIRIGDLPNLLVPFLILLLVSLMGFLLLRWGILSLFLSKAWFMSTSKKFIVYQGAGRAMEIPWLYFRDVQIVEGNSIILRLEESERVNQGIGFRKRRKNEIYISKVPDLHEVERICKKRIEENASKKDLIELLDSEKPLTPSEVEKIKEFED